MRHACPTCGILVKKHSEVRYLKSQWQEHYAIAGAELFYFECVVCRNDFILQIDKPLDEVLSKIKTVHRDFGLFNQAERKKPGIAVLGTTISEWSDIAHRNGSALVLISRYFDNPALVG